MADNVNGSSRSRKHRRSRSNRKKSKRCTAVTQNASMSAADPASTVITTSEHDNNVLELENAKVCETNQTDCDIIKTQSVCAIQVEKIETVARETYRVESPKTVQPEKKASCAMVKSRSLDDDDQVKITEILEESIQETAGKYMCLSESSAIVSEAESDVEWESVGELAVHDDSPEERFGKLSVICLPLEEHRTFEQSHISPEDERSLRDFLESLDLISSPEDSIKRIEKDSIETVKSRRTKKRVALVQHFLPYYQNPRYLDVISEEGSDLSDKDSKQCSSLSSYVLRENYLDDEDDVFEDINKDKKVREKFQSNIAALQNGAILVGTKLIDSEAVEPMIIEANTIKHASWSTSVVETRSDNAEVVYLEDSSSSMTPSDLLDLEEAADDADGEYEEDLSLDLDRSLSDNLDINSSTLTDCDSTTAMLTSDTISRASLFVDSEPIKPELLNQLTPLHTPENIFSNYNEKETEKINPLNKKSIDFLQHVISTLSTNNINEIKLLLIDESFETLPPETKSTVENIANLSQVKDVSNTDLNKVENEIQTLQNLIKEPSADRLIYTEDEEVYNTEFRNLCDSLNKHICDEYSNEAGISRPDSSSSACSSRSTSQCTAVYNPVQSSLTNIAAMLREGSFDDRVPEPSTLRELCVKTLLTMPFGTDVIEELATVSMSIEEMTSRTPSHLQNTAASNPKSASPNAMSFEAIHNTTDTDASSILLVNNPVVQSRPQSRAIDSERWVGMPTEEDPSVLLCLSPSQKHFIDTVKSVPNEADNLLDLHRKFIERRGYHEEHTEPAHSVHIPLTSLHIRVEQNNNDKNNPSTSKTNTEHNLLKIIQSSIDETKNEAQKNHSDSKSSSLHNANINYNDYIRRFTKEIPILETKSTAKPSEHKNIYCGSINYDNYIKKVTREVPIQVEKQINKPVNNKIYSASLPDVQSTERVNDANSRLKARHLSEWLSLARSSEDIFNNSNERLNLMHKSLVNDFHCNKSSTNKLVSQRSYEEHASTSQMLTRENSTRRYSLPYNLFEKQMQYIVGKEKEIQREIEKLNEEKSKLEQEAAINEDSPTNVEKLNEIKSIAENAATKSNEALTNTKQFDAGKYQISPKGDIAVLQSETPKLRPKSMPPSPSELFREQMYNEYMNKVAEREERKQHKVIKIKISTTAMTSEVSESQSLLNPQCEVKHVCGIEDEFMCKVRERMGKLGMKEEQSDDDKTKTANTDAEDDTEPILLMDGSSLTGAKKLPKHLKEFVDYARAPDTDSAIAAADAGTWGPGKSPESKSLNPLSQAPPRKSSPPKEQKSDEPAPVVWTPRSAGSSPTAERKEFRPVAFESPVLTRKNHSKESTPVATPEVSSVPPPWESTGEDASSTLSTSLERRLTTSHSAPAAGLSNLSKLPRAQNPTITLLQKAREGQLPRGASYIEQQEHDQRQQTSKDGRPPLIGPNEILYSVKTEYMSESESEKPKKMANLGPRKYEGIGPTTKDGMPIVLRSEVKDSNQAKWYKRMYDTLHRSRNDDELVTVRYKTRRGRYPYTSAGGYLSEPEPNAYDSDAAISASKYATLDRRRLQTNRDKENEYITYTIPRNKYMSASVKHSTDVYKNQPGRIENYVPGHSSISEKEAKEHLEQQKRIPPPSRSYMNQALKESGYESDSTLVFRRREDAALQLSPQEQKEVYKNIQKGGEVPLHGLRKLAPERPKEPVLGPVPPPKGFHDYRDVGSESPRKYVEDEVTIHYRSPVRHEIKEALSEEELARRQAEAMRRIYQEERRRKYLQELQDMNSRRHTDNFIPSQKSPIPLNRYDDFIDDLSIKTKPRDRSPEPRLVARALYNFVGQSSRELTFRKGDIIFVRRQVDKNWYEGEHNAMLGLFPSNYVEIIPYDGIKATPRKAHEGQARAKFNFIAQTHLELSLAKGELVVLTRRVDNNWYEGRIGNRKGIFPVSYVEVLIDPGEKVEVTGSSKPVASPAAHSLLLNGSAGGKESMGSHHYQPAYNTPQTTPNSYHAKPVNVIGTSTSYTSLTRAQKLSTPPVNEALHIDTQSDPVPYRALYKYRPQNDDELELQEGDTVYVLEKCDDGWFVGSSQRTGAFGTFPGNYVERI